MYKEKQTVEHFLSQIPGTSRVSDSVGDWSICIYMLSVGQKSSQDRKFMFYI